MQLSLDKITNQSPFSMVVLGGFNTKSSNWNKHNKRTYEGSKIDAVTSQFGLQKLIKEPTHILWKGSSCIVTLECQSNSLLGTGHLIYTLVK